MKGFEFVHRNTGHWDVVSNEGRLFRLRGGPSKFSVSDERVIGKGWVHFKTQTAAVSYICDELMFELIATESQEVKRIEDWNIS